LGSESKWSQGFCFGFVCFVSFQNMLCSQNAATIHPFAMSGCNRAHLADQFQAISVPNVVVSSLPEGVDMSMNAGEFVAIYGGSGYDFFV
jgi:hypothetical protein